MGKIINKVLDSLVCGGTLCGPTFRNWVASMQDDDADLWRDLTLRNSIPEPRPPPIPRTVSISISATDSDDISEIHDALFGNREEGKCKDFDDLDMEELRENHRSSPVEKYYQRLEQVGKRRWHRDDGSSYRNQGRHLSRKIIQKTHSTTGSQRYMVRSAVV